MTLVWRLVPDGLELIGCGTLTGLLSSSKVKVAPVTGLHPECMLLAN